MATAKREIDLRTLDLSRFEPPADVFDVLDEVFGAGCYQTKVIIEDEDVLLCVTVPGVSRKLATGTTVGADEEDIAARWRLLVSGLRSRGKRGLA